MKKIFALIGVLSITACSPRFYETAPVVVNSAQGPVICQLYTKEEVLWDRSISRPENMSVTMADTICIKEGYKLRGY